MCIYIYIYIYITYNHLWSFMYIYIVSSVSLPRTSQRGKLVPANEHVQLQAIYIYNICMCMYITIRVVLTATPICTLWPSICNGNCPWKLWKPQSINRDADLSEAFTIWIGHWSELYKQRASTIMRSVDCIPAISYRTEAIYQLITWNACLYEPGIRRTSRDFLVREYHSRS